MIILISGSINAGKSTVARLLSKKIERPALIEIDNLRDFISWVGIEDAIPINLENAVSVIRNLVARKFNIIVPYPLGDQDYRYLVENLRDDDPLIFAFTLKPSLAKAQTSTIERALDSWELERITNQYSGGLNPNFGVTIDNTFQSAEETANIIFKQINWPHSKP